VVAGIAAVAGILPETLSETSQKPSVRSLDLEPMICVEITLAGTLVVVSACHIGRPTLRDGRVLLDRSDCDGN
jgi:hypothetical protein